MDQELKNNLQILMGLSEEQLLIQIGEQLTPPSLGMAGQSEKKLIGYAKQWLSENSDKLKEKICNSNVVELYLNNQHKYDDVSLAAAILDLIVDIIVDVTPATVAVLIIKKGITSLCRDSSLGKESE